MNAMKTRLFAILASATLLGGNVGHASDSEARIETRIVSLLNQRCLECHGDGKRNGGFSIASRENMLLPNDSGKPAIIPGRPDESELLRRMETAHDDERMPPEGERLSNSDLALVRSWITADAPWDADSIVVPWSWQKITSRSHPRVTARDWVRNPIDTFVLAKLEDAGIQPTPPASPSQLLRRVHLDLTGLPPTPAQVKSWQADPSDAHYGKIVDQLISSPAFGEKWARHWLDQARFSDSNGYQADQLREMWAYRDWVIRAISADMPFDEFTIRQLAGDLLPDPTLDDLIATGFHRATTCNVEAGVDPEGNRVDQVIDRVNTTATVWLGVTLECAQCHNHKYDPISQRDYYQFFAFFNNTPLEVQQVQSGVQYDFWGPTMQLPQPADVSDLHATRQAQLKQLEKRHQTRIGELNAVFEDWLTGIERDPERWTDAISDGLSIERNKRSEQQVTKLRQHFHRLDETYTNRQANIELLKEQVAKLEPSTTLVMVELGEPRSTNILLRGQYQQPGPPVIADTPARLNPFPADQPRNRLGLARWMVGGDNPLVARVAVNRWWQEIFGEGLVRTPEDFGTQGEAPSHPDVLDYLASELHQHDWSLKQIIRLIVQSSTYRQSSVQSTVARDRDPTNQLLGRGPRQRLAAELIRDHSLFVSGLMSHRIGGSPTYPPQPDGLWKQTGRNEPVYEADQFDQRFRRGIYVIWRRAAPYPSFVNFDAPDRTSCVVKRPSSNTPLQALTLLNDEAFVEMAQAMAARVLQEDAADTIEGRVRYAFQLCLSRDPSAEELGVLRQMYHDERQRLANDLEAVAELTKNPLPLAVPAPKDPVEWAVWCCLANVLLNLDETITKS